MQDILEQQMKDENMANSETTNVKARFRWLRPTVGTDATMSAFLA